jgi:hypothetical protein
MYTIVSIRRQALSALRGDLWHLEPSMSELRSRSLVLRFVGAELEKMRPVEFVAK